MTFTLDAWPVIRSAHYGNVNGRTIKYIVLHTMESPEGATTAEAVARYFAGGTVKASAHLCVDNNSIVRCVDDNDVAYAAPGANANGLQIEMAGRAGQTSSQWSDTYSKAMLEQTAKAVAQYSIKYGIPVVHLTNSQLAAGQKGIIGHVQASQVFKKSSHWDPGPAFPWTFFLTRVRFWLPFYKNGRKWPTAPAPVVTEYGKPGYIIDKATGFRWLGITNPPMVGNDVNGCRNALRVAGNSDVIAATGPYDETVARIVAIFQDNRGITERGVGPETLEALREVVH